MGFSPSPIYWQNRLQEILREIPGVDDFLIIVHDDLLLHSKDKVSHKLHLRLILEKLREHGIKLCPRKVCLFRKRVIYLGHVVSIDESGLVRIEAMGDKCIAIRNMPVPRTPRQVRRFVGAVNYLSMYLPCLQTLLKPLHQLTRKKQDR